MIFRKTLSVVSFIVLTLSNICVASDSKDYTKKSANIHGCNITLMSQNGHENDVLFPQENNNNTKEDKELCLEFNNGGSYRVLYNNRINIDTSNIGFVPTLLNKYINVSSVTETIEKEMHFPFEEFIPVFTDCKKIVFNNMSCNCDDFDLVITNNRGETLGVVFNLSNDTKFGRIHLNNIDSLTVNTNNYNFDYNNISASPESTLKVLTRIGKSVSRIRN